MSFVYRNDVIGLPDGFRPNARQRRFARNFQKRSAPDPSSGIPKSVEVLANQGYPLIPHIYRTNAFHDWSYET